MRYLGFLKREISKQFIKFSIIGFFSIIVNLGIFYILWNYFSINYGLSALTGYIFAIIFEFVFNNKITFEKYERGVRVFSKYIFVYLITLGFYLGVLHVLVEQLLLDAFISNVILMPFVGFINFLGTKFVAFRDKRI